MNRLKPDDYLPRENMLRDINILLEYKGKERSTIRAPVVPSVCNDRGVIQVGVLATLIDLLGGTLAAKAVYPDYPVTGDIRIYSTRRATTDEVTAVGSVLRAGRAAVVIEAEIIAGTTESGATSTSIGSAIATFSRLPRRGENIDVGRDDGSHEVITWRADSPGPYQHLLDKAGLRVIDEAGGVVELNMSGYVRKSMITADLAICYLSQGKAGPFCTRTKVLRTTEDSVLTRVGIFDRGAGDLLMSVAMNTARIA